jgi:hypothetical protein
MEVFGEKEEKTRKIVKKCNNAVLDSRQSTCVVHPGSRQFGGVPALNVEYAVHEGEKYDPYNARSCLIVS